MTDEQMCEAVVEGLAAEPPETLRSSGFAVVIDELADINWDLLSEVTKKRCRAIAAELEERIMCEAVVNGLAEVRVPDLPLSFVIK